MPRTSTAPRWRGKIFRVAVPKTRAPFVNTPLLPLGAAADGREQFWISTYDRDAGCLGALVNEWGGCRLVRLDHEQHGSYSAVQTDPHTLWLCGHLDRLVRLDLRTLDFRTYPTGAPPTLVFQGMAFDTATGKLFALGAHTGRAVAFSFDTRKRRPVRLHEEFTSQHYMRFSFPNGDGTHTIVAHTPEVGLLRWDPVRETVESVHDVPDVPKDLSLRLVLGQDGRCYFPTRGWYDGRRGQFDASGPRPEREMTWFARREGRIYGATSDNEALAVGVWELASGRVTDFARVSDSRQFGVALTASGRLVAVNHYGIFFRWDLATAALERSAVLPTDVVNHTDRLCRVDKRHILGTPFISQRFWMADLQTGQGEDLGRAAPGGGEILAVWSAGPKAYMAAYTGGELMEFDPRRPARYPENPHVVADPPRAMRPISWAQDGRTLYYGCSAPYGYLGGTITAYDTRTGRATYAADPLPGHAPSSLFFDCRHRTLFVGTTPHADCQSAPAEHDRSLLAALDSKTLAVRATTPAPGGTQTARVLGPLDRGRLLCLALPRYNLMTDADAHSFLLDADSLSLLSGDACPTLPLGLRRIEYAGRPGRFVLLIDRRVELWDLAAQRRLSVLAERFGGYNLVVQDRSVYLLSEKRITVLEDCLRPGRGY